MEEAIEWVKRCPNPTRRGEIEIRQVFEAEDFGDEFTPELREQEDAAARPGGAEPVAGANGAAGEPAWPRMSPRAIDAVWRIESARLIAGLARIVRDVGAGRGPGAGRAGRGAGAVAARPASPTTPAPG